MRYERLKDIVKLAIRMQGFRSGVTLDEIQTEFGVGRRTAERMRDAVEWAFGPLEIAERGDNKRHWRLRSDALRRLAPLSAEELAELGSAADTLERTGFEARAAALRDLGTKLRATQRTDSLARIEADIEALVQAEGLAMRPGPRPQLDRELLALLREAITTCRIVEVRYLSQSTGRHSRQRIEPYGLLYGNRPFLVGRTDWNDAMRLWRLGNMSEAHVTGEAFTRDPRLRSGGLRPAFLRHLPGETRGRGAALHGRGKARRRRLPLPPRPDRGGECRRYANGPLRRWRHRRDVLAPRHLGRKRHDREAHPPPQSPRRHVRDACGTS